MMVVRTRKLWIIFLAVLNVVIIINSRFKPQEVTEFVEGVRKGTVIENLNIKEIEQRMITRRNYVQEKCRLFGLDSDENEINSKEFLINHNYKLVWCNVFKAASTSWLHNLIILAGYNFSERTTSSEPPLILARKMYPRPSVSQLSSLLKNYTSFLIVRHPFERLLSAYRDKIESTRYITYQTIGRHIIWRYRQDVVQRKAYKPPYPTFEEFVRYILDHQNDEQVDMHWVPINSFCTPCLVNFDFILKFDTLQEDQSYLIKHLKLESILSPRWRNQARGKDTKESTEEYYSQLSKNQVHQLYYMYMYDFEMFNFTMNEYLQMVRFEATVRQ